MKAPRYCADCASELREEQRDGLPRLICPAEGCGFVHWGNPTPVVAAIVEHQGKIILARNRAWPIKFFGLITGFLERDEDPADGVLREVKEELDLDGAAPALVGLYPFSRMNQLIIAYHVVAQGEVRLNEELVDYRAMALDEVKAWPAGTGFALRDWLRATHNIDPPMLEFGSRKPASAEQPS